MGGATDGDERAGPLPATEEHAVSWIRWVQAVRADPEKSWELGPPYEDMGCCFICQCEFSLFVRLASALDPVA